MTIPIGRKGKVFAKLESVYGTAEVLTATDFMRHVEVGFTYDAFNRVTSPEKKQSPGPVNRFDRKLTAELATLVGIVRPSGTPGTPGEGAQLLEAALGAVTAVPLSTTVSAAPAPTSTVFTVADVTGLVVGDMILVAADGGLHAREVAGINTLELTVTPALPAAPAASAAVTGGVTYKLTTDLIKSLTIAHYLEGFERQIVGAGVDSLTLAFDANEEVRATFAGPAAQQEAGQTEPVGATQVGGNPPSGLVGGVVVDGVSMPSKTLEFTITNGVVVRNQELGVNKPTSIYRNARREIAIALEAFAENTALLYNKALAGDNVDLLVQCGATAGNVVAVHCPRVEFKVPETDDPDEEVSWSYAAMALETADGQNDELRLALL